MKLASGAATSRMASSVNACIMPATGVLRAGANVGGGARNGASCGNAAEQRRSNIGDALRHKFHIGIVPVAGHAVGDHGGEQALERRQQRHCKRRGQQRQDSSAWKSGMAKGGRPLGIPPNLLPMVSTGR